MNLIYKTTLNFLLEIEEINKREKLTEGALLFTFDVTVLFTKIQEEVQLEGFGESLEERTEKYITPEFIVRLMELKLQNNFFELNDEIWKYVLVWYPNQL